MTRKAEAACRSILIPMLCAHPVRHTDYSSPRKTACCSRSTITTQCNGALGNSVNSWSSCMAKSKPQFDHAVINVEDDLDKAVALFTRFGFHFTDRGHHSHGSSNHLAVFGDTFLELLGYEQGRMTPETYHWKHPRGLTA